MNSIIDTLEVLLGIFNEVHKFKMEDSKTHFS